MTDKVTLGNSRSEYNSIDQLVTTLKHNPFISENDLMFEAFGYDRNMSSASNKKYADMLRRGLGKGLYVKINIKDFPSANFEEYSKKTTYVYALLWQLDRSLLEEMVLFNSMKLI